VTSVLEVRDLTVEVATMLGPQRAVDGVSFSMAAGEVLGLVGESGSGKTLTCRSILRLLPRRARIAGGTIDLAGRRVTDLPERQLTEIRGTVASMIFQNPASHLDPVMTIGDQIAAPLRVHEGLSRAEARGRARELLERVGIPDPARGLDQYPHEFSGGMRQRAMIAAALACRPKLLIADEPTTALDVTVQAQILRLLLDLRDRLGLAILLVTHDLGVVAQTCDRLAVMYAGRIVETGPKPAVLGRPLHAYTAGLIASQPGATEPGAPLASIPGQPPSLGSRPSGCAFHPRCPIAVADCSAAPPPEDEPVPNHRTACLRWQVLAEVA
jgi:peptide/nickel transport system ATP-binding protein